jgi:hypothetical protein
VVSLRAGGVASIHVLNSLHIQVLSSGIILCKMGMWTNSTLALAEVILAGNRVKMQINHSKRVKSGNCTSCMFKYLCSGSNRRYQWLLDKETRVERPVVCCCCFVVVVAVVVLRENAFITLKVIKESQVNRYIGKYMETIHKCWKKWPPVFVENGFQLLNLKIPTMNNDFRTIQQ